MPIDLNLVLAAVSILLFLGLIGYFAFLIRHQERAEPEEREVFGVELLRQHYEAGDTVEQPTPYWVSPIPSSPDPLEIAGNLDKKIVLGAATLLGLFGLIGVYLLLQLGIIYDVRATAMEHQLRQDVVRGKAIYAQLCYDCHGRDGRGGTTPDGDQLPGFPLNKPDFKHANIAEDPQRVTETRTLIETTITRGRDNPPGQYDMPAWGRSEGGPLSLWQVKQLADLIMYGTDEDWADTPHIREEHLMPVAEQVPPPPAVPSGEEVVLRGVCASCHTTQEDATSPNPFAPNLANYGTAGPFGEELRALRDSGDPDWLVKWISDPPEIKPGTAMPPMNIAEGGTLDEETIREIAEYLMTLGTE